MTQYAVVWRPDDTHVPRILGPYRSRDRAADVLDEMMALEDTLALDVSLIPEMVAFEDWRDVKRELIENYGDPT